jgi:hypothetical protein
MKIQIVKTISFNEERERKRLEECFMGATLKRQIAILDAFVARDFRKAYDLYQKLPYNKKEGCSEKEFVGCYFADLLGELESVSGVVLKELQRFGHACVVEAKVKPENEE